MGKIFGLDSYFYKYGVILCDLIIITVLWCVCSLPIFTIGASTTAVYYVTTRQLSDREGYVSRDFFKSFKQNFVQATLVTLLIGLVSAILFINIILFQPDTLIETIIVIIQYVILYQLIIFTIYVFPLLSRFKFKFFELLKNAFFMANRHLLTTFTCLILLFAIYQLVLRYFILIFVAMGFYAILTSLMFMKVFRKYVPEMDKDV